MIIGKPAQRVAMVLCWVLMAAHTFLQHAVMVKLQNDLIDEVGRWW